MDYLGEGVGQRVCWPPLSNYCGPGPPLPTPMRQVSVVLTIRDTTQSIVNTELPNRYRNIEHIED